MKTYYTYLWLRDNGVPYYVGKGSGDRAFGKSSHRVKSPKDRTRILIQDFPDESSAFAAEIFLISFYGREDLKTGHLLNLTPGGENPPRNKTLPKWTESRKQRMREIKSCVSAETRAKQSDAAKRRGPTNIGKTWKHSVSRSFEHRAKISAYMKLRPITEETRSKMRAAQINRVPWNRGNTGGTWTSAQRAARQKNR
jgi:hypothetical protein